MRFSPVPVALAFAAVLTSSLASPGASAAPPGISARNIDLELKAADVKNVFKLLAEVGGRKITLDPCVHGTVDLKLVNTPLPLVLDALAMKLGLVYDEQDGDVLVRCLGDSGADDAKLLVRVTVNVKGAALPDVVGALAGTAKLEGVDYRAKTRPNVNLTLENVRLPTAVSALGDTTGLRITVSRGRLVVADGT